MMTYNSTWSILIEPIWVMIVRWQSDLHSKHNKDLLVINLITWTKKHIKSGGDWWFAELCNVLAKVIFIEIGVVFNSAICAQNLMIPFLIFTKLNIFGSLNEVLSGLVYKTRASRTGQPGDASRIGLGHRQNISSSQYGDHLWNSFKIRLQITKLWAGHNFAARSCCDLKLQGSDPNLHVTHRLNISLRISL